MTYYKARDESCKECGRPEREHKQYRDAMPPHCPKAPDTSITLEEIDLLEDAVSAWLSEYENVRPADKVRKMRALERKLEEWPK